MKTPGEQGRPAVFLDRDGTIIEDLGDLSQPSQVVFFDDTFQALRRLAPFFALFIVTNQSGVAKGSISIQDVHRVNSYVQSRLAEEGVPIVATYVCPHKRDEGCCCIKPSPYFLNKAACEHGIDLHRSYVIGDHPHDVVLASHAGARGIYLLTGHGMQHRDEIPESASVASGIREAAELILQELKRSERLRESNA
ncbi:MAG TPA: HAD family hydrolase [bacterium]|nr:HAD family hydrolase [bacterium]